MKKPTITDDDIWRQFAQPRTTEGKTINQLAAIWQCSRPTADHRVRCLIKAGQIKVIGKRPGRGNETAYELVGGK